MRLKLGGFEVLRANNFCLLFLSIMSSNQAQFIEFALTANVLRFGEFKTKAGRMSPYFFNAGLFNTGSLLDRLGAFYAQALLEAKKQAASNSTCSLVRPIKASRWSPRSP